VSTERKRAETHDIATREEALALLTEHARAGSATAAAALARELRAEERREESLDAELEAVLAKNSVESD
jgi:hypothetical protein